VENVDMFYDHLEYFFGNLVQFRAVWYILWSFGIAILWSFGIFSRFGIFVPRKIWQP
jgi:hypothetical protein